MTGQDLLPKVVARGVSLAGGLHKDIKMEYFRIGHMGQSTRIMEHAIATIDAIEAALIECGYVKPLNGKASDALKKELSGLPLTPVRPPTSPLLSWLGLKLCCGSRGSCPVPLKCQLYSVALVAVAFGAGVLVAHRRK